MKKSIDVTPYGSQKNVNQWSKNRKFTSHLYPSEKKFFLKILNRSSSFLDLGCATGNFVKIIKTKTKIKFYFGVDTSKNMIDRAKLLYPKYNFIKYDGKIIDIRKKFDISFCFGTLQYCNNYQSLITQMFNFSKKFVNFDLRLTFDPQIINKKKSYQIIPNSKNKKLPYNIINIHDFIKFLLKLTNSKYSLKLYGYKQRPAKTVRTIYKDVFMTSILIDKTKNFELKIDLNEKLKK